MLVFQLIFLLSITHVLLIQVTIKKIQLSVLKYVILWFFDKTADSNHMLRSRIGIRRQTKIHYLYNYVFCSSYYQTQQEQPR